MDEYVVDDVPPVAAGVDDGVCVFYDSEGEAGVFHLSSDFVDWTAHPNLTDNCSEIVADRAFTCGQEATLSDFLESAPQQASWAVIAGKLTPKPTATAVHTFVAKSLNKTVQKHQLAYIDDLDAKILFEEGSTFWTMC